MSLIAPIILKLEISFKKHHLLQHLAKHVNSKLVLSLKIDGAMNFFKWAGLFPRTKNTRLLNFSYAYCDI